MTRRALGRGLSALLSDRPTTSSEELVELNLDLIEANNLQPRSVFNEEKLEELAQSIRENGIIQPLLVRSIGGGKYQLVAGERRWRAAQRAGLLRVPCVVREIPDEKMLELALIENIQRQELNAIEEAQAYKRLIESLSLTQEMVAQRVGRDRTFITNYLRLLRLPEDIQRLVEEEKISMGHARTLLGVDDVEIQRKLAQRIIEQQLSVREIERLIKRVIAGEDQAENANEKAQNTEDANVKFAQDKLRRKLGSKVQIKINSNNSGKIEIEFYNSDDLNRVFQILMGASKEEARLE